MPKHPKPTKSAPATDQVAGTVLQVVSAENGETREPRHLFAVCRMLATMVVAVADSAEAKKTAKTNGGRWRLNAGSEMTMRIWGINMQMGPWGMEPKPVRIVIDMASAAFDKPVISALKDHVTYASEFIIGNWSDAEISPAGIDASLRFYEARTPAEEKAFTEAIRIRAMLEQGQPWEASVGAYPKDGVDGYQPVKAGQTVSLNGRSYSGDGDLPLFVMKGARISEGSVVLWGADSDTGQLAAQRTRPTITKDQSMYDLAKILAANVGHEALAAKLVSAAQALPEAERPEAADLDAEIAAAVKVAVKDAEITALKAENEALKKAPPLAKPLQKPIAQAQQAPAFAAGGADESEAPATLHGAMSVMAAENPKLKGFHLRAAALKRWPDLRKTIPDAQIGAR